MAASNRCMFNPKLVVLNVAVCNFYEETLFCILLRPCASFALIYALLRAFACFYVPCGCGLSPFQIFFVSLTRDSHVSYQEKTRLNSWSLPVSKSSLRSLITDVPCSRLALASIWSSSKPRRSASSRNTSSNVSPSRSKIWLQNLPDNNTTSTTPQAQFPQQPQRRECFRICP